MGSEGLMYNCYDFFMLAMPMTIILFIFGRFILNLLDYRRISK